MIESLINIIKKYKYNIILLLILIVGFYIRIFIGLNWDENQHLHPDERFLTMVTTAIRFPKNILEYFNSTISPLNPYNNNYGFFVYGTFPIFLTKLISEIVKMSGYGEVHILGRILSSLFDLGTMVILYLIGKKLFSKAVGLFAAFFLAFSVLNIQLSHFYGVETQTAFFIALTFLFSIEVLYPSSKNTINKKNIFLRFLSKYIHLPEIIITDSKNSKTSQNTFILKFTSIKNYLTNKKSYILSGIFFGLALSSKISALYFAPVFFVFYIASIYQEIRNSKKHYFSIIIQQTISFSTLFIFAFFTFRIFQPYAFQSFSLLFDEKWLKNMAESANQQNGIADYPPSLQWVDQPSIWYSLKNLVIWYMGSFWGVLAIIAFIFITIKFLKNLINLKIFSDLEQFKIYLPWIYVGIIFFYQSTRFVKVGRYFISIFPFLALISAYFLVFLINKIYDLFKNKSSILSLGLPSIIILIIILGHSFWGSAFLSIYSKQHTRIESSYWILDNIPVGSKIGNEHWDDGLPLRVAGKDPFGGMFTGVEIQNYSPSTSEYMNRLVDNLEKIDYYITSSNRIYGSIKNLPERFPATIAFYQKLFAGELGFDLIAKFTSYPSILGMEFNDDLADESFTVYDHPQVHIFKKNASFNADAIREYLTSFPEPKIWPLTPNERNLKANPKSTLSESIQQANLNADNRYYFVLNNLSSQNLIFGFFYIPLAIIVWLFVMEIIGLIFLPICMIIFKNFKDKGYSLSKTFGLLISAWLVWLAASLKIAQFNYFTIFVVILFFVLINLLFIIKKLLNNPSRKSFLLFIKTEWKLLIFEELLFLLAFIFLLIIRMQNPDIWQPWRGGEKIFEQAFLAGITKSAYFPPYDPWFVGGNINYYYFGQYIISFLTKLSGLSLRVVFTLATPTIFALTVVNVFSIVFNFLSSLGSQKNQ